VCACVRARARAHVCGTLSQCGLLGVRVNVGSDYRDSTVYELIMLNYQTRRPMQFLFN
jgi:hypothetical protein